ncbi:hypothetical protein ANO11243_028110 [Dothideomycetidae sp. 11243]|nr:hypothetical protein ANO11243_028110 [fungal sp. No.11243]
MESMGAALPQQAGQIPLRRVHSDSLHRELYTPGEGGSSEATSMAQIDAPVPSSPVSTNASSTKASSSTSTKTPCTTSTNNPSLTTPKSRFLRENLITIKEATRPSPPARLRPRSRTPLSLSTTSWKGMSAPCLSPPTPALPATSSSRPPLTVITSTTPPSSTTRLPFTIATWSPMSTTGLNRNPDRATPSSGPTASWSLPSSPSVQGTSSSRPSSACTPYSPNSTPSSTSLRPTCATSRNSRTPTPTCGRKTSSTV